MIMGTRSMVKRHRFLPKLKIDGVALDYVLQSKYMGITIDESLTFHNHLENTIKILAHKIYLLQKIRSYINDDAAIKMYKTMILPYADYGDIFFINANNKQLQKLETLQNRALRICLNVAIYIPVEVLHQSAQLPMLRVRRMVHLRNFMFKMKTNIKYLNTRNIHMSA